MAVLVDPSIITKAAKFFIDNLLQSIKAIKEYAREKNWKIRILGICKRD